mgnify:CR=1 FL=1
MLFFENIPVGYSSEVGTWQLNDADVIKFAKVWDPHTYHTDQKAAEASVFGELVASSLHIFAICTRLFHDHADKIQVMAMLGKDRIRLPEPARASDLLIYNTVCIDAESSSSKPDRGIIVLSDTLARDTGEVVMTQEVTLMVARLSDQHQFSEG